MTCLFFGVTSGLGMDFCVIEDVAQQVTDFFDDNVDGYAGGLILT